MQYIIQEQDKNTLLQNMLNYKYKLLVINSENMLLGELTSIQGIGEYNIDSESNVRRSTSVVLYLDESYKNKSVEKQLYTWIGCSFELQIGVYNIRNDNYIWYRCGYYLITEANTSYNSIENSLSTTLSDWYTKLDGTRNGQIGGAPIISIPNKTEQISSTGETIVIPTTLKNIVEDTLLKYTDIENYIVDDVGEFYGMEENNVNYKEYRENRYNHKIQWNQLPYDLEYSSGCMISEIFDEIVNLYPNNQMYFDVFGNFCFNMIPSLETSPIVLDDEFIQKILLSENAESVSYDVTTIKNVTEIFGATYEIDRGAIDCETIKGKNGEIEVYRLTISSILLDDSYVDYEYNGNDIISFMADTTNIAGMKLLINNLVDEDGNDYIIPIYYEDSETPISANEICKDETYVVQIKYLNGYYCAFYLGQFQPHSICVLSDNKSDKKFTKKYFSEKYNCKEKDIIIRYEEGSPFSVQKLGEILDSKSGDEFENIISDSNARENALYQNIKSTSSYDTVTIVTKLIPFLDVQCKVSYKKQQDTEEYEYIIKSINNDINNKTSSITMKRFYPLYFE